MSVFKNIRGTLETIFRIGPRADFDASALTALRTYKPTDASGNLPIIEEDLPSHMRWGDTSAKTYLFIPVTLLGVGEFGEAGIFSNVNLTSDQTYTLPNKSGTMALTSDLAFSGALITRSTNFAVATGGAPATDMDWNAESYDTNGFFNVGTDNSAFIIPAGGAGDYVAAAQINWAANATGMRVARMFVDRGSGYTNEAGCATLRTMAVTGAAQMTEMNLVSAPLSLAVGDKVIIRVGQDSGGNLNVVSAPTSWFSLRRL